VIDATVSSGSSSGAASRDIGIARRKSAMSDNTARIRELNDQFRTTLTGGKVYMTNGVDALAPDLKARALEAMRTFTAFTADNDPHKEHDFGAFTLEGTKLFWKIDYFDKRDPDLGAEDPADAATTERVLTLMLADEY
jgi:Protein of unknown function (DUF3768)